MTVDSTSNTNLLPSERDPSSGLGRPQTQPLSSMSHQTAAVSADNQREHSSSLHHQFPSIAHHERNELATPDKFTAIQNSSSDENLAAASSAVSAPRLIAQETLSRLEVSSAFPGIAPLPSGEAPGAGGPSMQFDQNEESNQDVSMVFCRHRPPTPFSGG
jgi:hypothetical protein